MIMLPSCARAVALGLLVYLPFTVGIKLDLENDGRNYSSTVDVGDAEQPQQILSKVLRAL